MSSGRSLRLYAGNYQQPEAGTGIGATKYSLLYWQTPSIMAERDFDVVLYGASGFTGRQTVAYIAAATRPTELRWAIAGRNRDKLEAVRATLGERGRDIEVIVADAGDQAALDSLAARTRVVLTTAGPYALYGSGLVDACVRQRTHYVDITGETVWVRDLIDRHQAQAEADGTRIIPFCGFDSVPSDLGAYLMSRHLRQLSDGGGRVTAWYQMRGGLNGGTMATAFNLYDSGEAGRAADLFLLNPSPRRSMEELAANGDPVGPCFDRDAGFWGAPFVMGPINTRVVRRSAALFDQWNAGYGPDFTYQEYTKFSGTGGLIGAALLSAGSAAFRALMQSPFRRQLKSLAPKPGEGPSEKTMNEGWFRCELVASAVTSPNSQSSPDARSLRPIRGLIAAKGDPGNRSTVRFLCESALALALEPERLPGGPARGGILTPATGLGDLLIDRLRRSGMTIEIKS